MAIQDGHGKIATTGLIFGYDIKDTINSYLGEPTTNICNNADFSTQISGTAGGSFGGWTFGSWDSSNTHETVTDTYNGQQINALKITLGNYPAHFFSSNWGTSTIPGRTYTWTNLMKGTPGQVVQMYSHWGNLLTVTLTGEWQEYSTTFVRGGSLGQYMYYNPSHTTTGNVIYVTRVQVEEKSHKTAFTISERNTTQSLLDLTRTKTISLANASFNADSEIILDGTDDYISGGPSTEYLPLPYHSLEACIKSPSLGSGMNTCAIFGITYGLIVQIYASGEVGYYAYTTDGGTQVLLFSIDSSGINLLDDNWHHIVCTRDNSNVNIYVDGVLNRTTGNGGSWSGTNVWSSMTMLIGNNPNNIYYYFNGSIGVAKIYNRALNSSEVLQNFKTYRTKYSIS